MNQTYIPILLSQIFFLDKLLPKNIGPYTSTKSSFRRLIALVYVYQLGLYIVRNGWMFLIFHCEFTLSLQLLEGKKKISVKSKPKYKLPSKHEIVVGGRIFTCVIERRAVEYPNILLRGTWNDSQQQPD